MSLNSAGCPGRVRRSERHGCGRRGAAAPTLVGQKRRRSAISGFLIYLFTLAVFTQPVLFHCLGPLPRAEKRLFAANRASRGEDRLNVTSLASELAAGVTGLAQKRPFASGKARITGGRLIRRASERCDGGNGLRLAHECALSAVCLRADCGRPGQTKPGQ